MCPGSCAFIGSVLVQACQESFEDADADAYLSLETHHVEEMGMGGWAA